VEGGDGMSALAIDIRDLHLSRGSRTILSGIDLQVEPGAVVALMGASGSGKTTILRSMLGLEPFDRGQMTIDSLVVGAGPLDSTLVRALRAKTGMVFQFHCLFEHLSVIDNVTLAPIHVHKKPRHDAEAEARVLLKSLDVEHRAQALPRELSGGEAQRVAIARALATDPPILAMDEPTASLDAERRNELAALVKSLAGRHRTVVIVTHDEDFARATATRVVYLKNGELATSM
jgi:ABC-type polar amino acid transport system ATPase subunit